MANKCDGIVEGSLLGVASMITYTHADGSVCYRPGNAAFEKDTKIHSTFESLNGLCEHTIESVEEPNAPITLEQIVKAHATPDVPDAPVTKDVIERAAIPPKIKTDVATCPAYQKNLAEMPVENRFDGSLTSEQMAELVAAQHESRTFAGGSGRPMNPFSNDFELNERPDANEFVKQTRRGNKPTSPFDW